MTRKTRKHSAPQGVHTIPQLRRLFEQVELFVDERIAKHVSKETLVKEFRKEWKQLFMRELNKSAAEAFIDARMKSKKILRHTRKHGTKHSGGGPIAGAPLDYTTRPGVYLAPGQIPNPDGSLPTIDGGGYGIYNSYVNQGFWNPEDSSTLDPVSGQQPWPQPYATTGSNVMGGGAKKNGRRKIRGGVQLLSDAGAVLTQAFTRPFPSSIPANIGQDMQSMFYGGEVGPSPDQVSRQVTEVPLPYRPPPV